MPHYKSPDNSLHFLDSAEFESLLPDGSVRITDAEADAIRAASVPAPTLEQIVSVYDAAVQSYLDTFASTWRYESILSAASYAASTVAQFKAESLALIAWRDQVWASCYATLAAVQNGTQAMPASPEAFIATLPAAPARP